MKTGYGLAQHAIRAANERWGYVHGTFGGVLTGKAKVYAVYGTSVNTRMDAYKWSGATDNPSRLNIRVGYAKEDIADGNTGTITVIT